MTADRSSNLSHQFRRSECAFSDDFGTLWTPKQHVASPARCICCVTRTTLHAQLPQTTDPGSLSFFSLELAISGGLFPQRNLKLPLPKRKSLFWTFPFRQHERNGRQHCRLSIVSRAIYRRCQCNKNVLASLFTIGANGVPLLQQDNLWGHQHRACFERSSV